jgi:hypothetical protein
MDSKGLVALWRETLLAKHVLSGLTKGYKNHPQLNRFKLAEKPVNFIDYYLSEVFLEAQARGYNFNRDKIDWNFTKGLLNVTSGQIEYEKTHLLKKLKERDPNRYQQLAGTKNWEPHPLFKVIPGDIEDWEITT